MVLWEDSSMKNKIQVGDKVILTDRSTATLVEYCGIPKWIVGKYGTVIEIKDKEISGLLIKVQFNRIINEKKEFYTDVFSIRYFGYSSNGCFEE